MGDLLQEKVRESAIVGIWEWPLSTKKAEKVQEKDDVVAALLTKPVHVA